MSRRRASPSLTKSNSRPSGLKATRSTAADSLGSTVSVLPLETDQMRAVRSALATGGMDAAAVELDRLIGLFGREHVTAVLDFPVSDIASFVQRQNISYTKFSFPFSDVALPGVRRRPARRALQPVAVAGGDGAAAGHEHVESLELSPAERRLHVGELGVRAGRQVGALVIVPRVDDAAHERLRARHRSALAGGDDLGRVERADGQRPAGAGRPAGHRGPERLGAVLDDRHGQGRERLEIHGQAESVGHDGAARARRASRQGVPGGQRQRARVGVGQDGDRPTAHDGVVQGVARIARHEHLVPGTDVQRPEGELESGRARGDGRDRLDAQPTGEDALERRHFRPLGDVPADDHPGHALGVLRRQREARVRDHRFSSRRTDWKASAYFTRAWMPRKLAHDLASSRIVRSSMLVFVTCDRCASSAASFRSSTFSMSV